MMIEPISQRIMSSQIDSQVIHTDELARRSETKESAELRKVTKEFEALFVKMMLDSMRDTLDDQALIPKNSGEKLFEDRLYDEYAKKIGRVANLGIATMMYDQLSQGLSGDNLAVEA